MDYDSSHGDRAHRVRHAPFRQRLTESGFTERQAETLADEQVALLNANLATKADIAAVKGDVAKFRAELKGDIAKVRAELKADIATVKADLLKWMIGALIAQGGLVVGPGQAAVTESAGSHGQPAPRHSHIGSSGCCANCSGNAGTVSASRIARYGNRGAANSHRARVR